MDLRGVSPAELLRALAATRLIFHSEADFQHAPAWHPREMAPDASYRLELPAELPGKRIYLDLVALHPQGKLLVELKYKTQGLEATHDGERFSLKIQSAQDLGRYDFLKDVWRLEQLVASSDGARGWAILLTNDSACWAPSRDAGVACGAFSLSEGRTLEGEMARGPGAGQGTMEDRESSIVLVGSYQVRWEDYSRVDQGSYSRSRALCIEVGPA